MSKKNLINNFSFSQNKKNVINDYIYKEYEKNIGIKKLLRNKSYLIDSLLKKSWDRNSLKKENICLISVGGYGRSELFPYSDIDILILIKNYNDKEVLKNIERFIADIWHLKVQVGHAVRSVDDCITAINKDVTIYTNILDCRLLMGDKLLYNDLLKNVKNKNI